MGVHFDDGLTMADAVSKLVSDAGWKLKTLLRTRAYYTDADLVVLYKSHLLGFLEYRMPATYHTTKAIFDRLDSVQTRFLGKSNIEIL